MDLGDDFGDGGAEVVGSGSAMGFDCAGGVDAIGAVVHVSSAEGGAGGFVHLEVKMGQVFAIGVSDATDGLTANDGFVEGNGDRLEVGIHRLHDAAVAEAMGDEEGLSPTRIGFACVDDEAVTDGVDGVTEVGVHPADAIEVVASVTTAALGVHFPKGLRIVAESAVGGAHGVIEATGAGDAKAINAGEHFEAWVEGRNKPSAPEFAGLAVGCVRFLGGPEAANAATLGLSLPPNRVDQKGGREENHCDGDAMLELH